MAKKIVVLFLLLSLIATSFLSVISVRAIPAGVGVMGDSGSQPYQCNGRGGEDTFVWSEVLERLRGIDFGPGVCQEYNQAWAGEMIQHNMDDQTTDVLADFNAGKIGKVIIMLGYNDLYSTQQEPDIPALLAEYRRNVERLLAAGMAPENILIIDISQENWQGPKIEQVNQFNAGLKDLADEKGTAFGSHVAFKAEAACRSTDNQNTYNYGGHTIYNRYGDDWQSFRTQDGHLGTLSNGTLANTTMLDFLGITRMTDTELLTLVNQEPHPTRAAPDCAGAKTTTTITGDSPDPSDRNQAVTVSFTVTSTEGTPTGNVTVTDSISSATCTGTVEAGSCSLTLATGGARRLTATYAGNNKFATSTDTEDHSVNRASTTTNITGDSPEPTVVGQAFTVNYTVTSTEGSPTGNVTVSDGVNSCSGTVSAGSCSLTLFTAGNRTLTASYGGDSNFNTSSDTEQHSVSQASTTTTITGDSPDPSVYNQAVTVNYSVVANSPGSGTPGGNVTVSDGANSCTGTVAAGSCSITLSTLGARTLTATYAGNSNYAGSSSAGADHTVNKANTTTTITGDSPDPSVIGQAVTVNYSVVANSPGNGTPGGNVTVSDGANSCTGTVLAGNCAITLSTLGARTLTATYAGDSNFNSSTSTSAAHTVNKISTTTTITGDSPDPSVVGQAVTVNYTVTSTSGTPGGNVTVSDGVNSCTGTVAAGMCSLTLSTAGARSLTATYGGDSNYAGSTSPGATHTVTKASTTTTITGHSPDPSVVGLSVTVSYTVTSTGGTPSGNVTVSDGVDSCVGTVAAGSCSITLSTLGPRTLTATYEGDNNFAGSASAGTAHTTLYGVNLASIAAQDGWLLESGETTSKGGTLNKAATFLLGDNAQNKQYRSILSFTTKGLPDNAVITKVTLKVKKQGVVGGGNPVNLFQGFLVDVRKGIFGSAAGLQASDFQAKANKSYGPFKPALSKGWYTIDLTPAKGYINKLAKNGGVTQIRLRFKLDDNNNAVANYLSLYSGNAPTASQPQLIIEYYVP